MDYSSIERVQVVSVTGLVLLGFWFGSGRYRELVRGSTRTNNELFNKLTTSSHWEKRPISRRLKRQLQRTFRIQSCMIREDPFEENIKGTIGYGVREYCESARGKYTIKITRSSALHSKAFGRQSRYTQGMYPGNSIVHRKKCCGLCV